MKNRIPLYNLNNYLRFEKNIYQILGKPLGRPIPLKGILYALGIGVVEIILYFTPIINVLIRWIPPGILIVIPIGLAYLLNDVGTEDRKPLSFFGSFLKYHIRKIKGDSYYRNRIVQKRREYSFANYVTVNDVKQTSVFTQEEVERAEKDRLKALRYMERINNPDNFFAELRRKELLERKLINRIKRLFIKKSDKNPEF